MASPREKAGSFIVLCKSSIYLCAYSVVALTRVWQFEPCSTHLAKFKKHVVPVITRKKELIVY